METAQLPTPVEEYLASNRPELVEFTKTLLGSTRRIPRAHS
jgi:hypothetical protein